MKIFSAEQIRKCDSFTIENEQVSSIDLMERAAESCVNSILQKTEDGAVFLIFCGNGNNGGDGFAIARMLYQSGFDVNVFINKDQAEYSTDAKINFNKVKGISGIGIFDFDEIGDFQIDGNAVIIDALFGTGLNRSLDGKSAKIIQFLNELSFPKFAIDIPSGLFADRISEDNPVIFKADETLSFQFWKRTFLHPETGIFCGKINILDIGLSKDFIEREPSKYFVIDENLVKEIFTPRNDFSHKGSFGKTTIMAGSYGKMGAAVLATKSALKSGSGLTFTLAPNCGYEILQTTCPEAMFLYGGEDYISNFSAEEDAAIGIGPGLGTDPETETAFLTFLKNYQKPLLLDADALNIIAKNPENLNLIPKKSIITPHPKEFARLFGETKNSLERLELAKRKSAELGIYMVLKDHHTQIITPENDVFYNITGNSGMAKGGSGDVLLGIITSLLAQNYSPKNAAIFGVWLHGKAGDLAAEKYSKQAMLPSDLMEELGNVFKTLD
ncbi:bifunctional ADP-dependent NAD(P)H-hydrate dehydratase/NAD(P)H-hydrate epimerase [Chryseobacterium koreense]|uniref:Bifunctional NAD(P)H-hydrate repair enzyme n=2 Tax=root TaxID=1 RepID=A0A0J7IW60_9FLAO|nr:bifunctional ADP-dependent NAD(P)H-hydrate dehydratase/NAD(P)H-hydrate epimerase [Chryseobacterium koreense]KMQ70543.1 sugar kinase [Chryseobacterium koreense CCUG 49689]MBB5334343.1 NAD(P)H-hydrate epimerase [Chryseobacterium koreense]